MQEIRFGGGELELVESTDYVLPKFQEFDVEVVKKNFIQRIMEEIVNGSRGMVREIEFRGLKKKIDRCLKKKKNIDNRTIKGLIDAKLIYIKEKGERKLFHGEKLFFLMNLLSLDRNVERRCGNIWCTNFHRGAYQCQSCETSFYCSEKCWEKFQFSHGLICARNSAHFKQNSLSEVK